MTVVIYDDNTKLIQSLKEYAEIHVITFIPSSANSIFSQTDVSGLIKQVKNIKETFFLINLESNYSIEARTSLLGFYFFQCLIREFESSQNFNYFFYSFMSIGKIAEINDYAYFIKQKKHKQLPFNFNEIISTLWRQ